MLRLKTTFRLLIAAVAGIGIYFAISATKSQVTNSKAPNAKLVTTSLSEIDNLAITSADGIRKEFKRTKDGWQIIAPVNSKASDESVMRILDFIEAAPSYNYLTDNELKLRELTKDDFGLADPRGIIEVSGPKTSLKIFIGAAAPDKREVYALINDGTGINVTSAVLADILETTLENFSDKSITTANIRDANVVIIEKRDHLPIRIERNENRYEWNITLPEEGLADRDSVDAFFGILTEGKIKRFDYASNYNEIKTAPLLTIRIFSKGEPFPKVFSVFAPKNTDENVYVCVNDTGANVLIDRDVIERLISTANNMRNRRIFNFTETLELKRLAITVTNNAPIIINQDETMEWRLVSPINISANPSAVANLISGILALTADGYISVTDIKDGDTLPLTDALHTEGPIITLTTDSATNTLAVTRFSGEEGVEKIIAVLNDDDMASLLPTNALDCVAEAVAAPQKLMSDNFLTLNVTNISEISVSSFDNKISICTNSPATVLIASLMPNYGETDEKSDHTVSVVRTEKSSLIIDALSILPLDEKTNESVNFDEPLMMAYIKNTDGTAHTITFASITEDGKGVYARLAGRDVTYILPISLYTAFNNLKKLTF